MDSIELSVVIASRNRRELLARCLAALAGQTQDPQTFEVVIADDGSTDGTAETLAELETPFRLRHLRLAQSGRAVARNTGIEAAEGRICLILDDDVIADPGLVAGHVEAHRGADRVLGIGKLVQQPTTARDWYAHCFAEAWRRHYDSLERKPPDWTAGYGGNLSAPRAALGEVGGFTIPELPVDDIDLAFRLDRAGCRPRYLPGASGLHDDQKRRPGLLRDSRLQGEAHVDLSDREPGMRPHLLGWFTATTRREVMLRRLLIALRVPPVLLARLGPVVPGKGRQRIWFDFVTRFAFWKAVRGRVSRGRWVQLTRGTPVLMYHAFGETPEPDRYVVPARAFSMQMRVLAALRYRVIPFEELVETLREHGLPPRRAVVITIDDGYADNLEVALPILRRHRFPVSIFLVSRRIGGTNDWSNGGMLEGRPLLGADQLPALRRDAVALGAHTRTHCVLPEVADERVDEEVGGSRDDLEEWLGEPVTTFAYPYGRFDDRAVAAVRRSGFTGACTTEPHLARFDADPLRIPRIEVRAADSLPRFLSRLWFGDG